MERQIIQTVKDLFALADRRDWVSLQKLFADTVLMDYTSMNGGKPQKQSSNQIVDGWAALLPGFDKTHHQVSDFKVKQDGDDAFVTYYGKADEYLNGDVCTVEANYETTLIFKHNRWLITAQKLDLLKISGNNDLPKQAGVIAKTKGIRKVSFNSEGVTLKGNLHVPSNFSDESRYQGIVVTGSWTTVKEQMADLYATKLANQGFVALTFDFTSYGESEGSPRTVENLKTKATDISNAVEFLKTLAFIDTENIGGLGICASAGAMACAIANGASIRQLNFVAPWLHTPELVKPLYGGDEAVKQKLALSDTATDKYMKTGEVDYVPAASATDKNAAMPGDFPYYLDASRGAIKEWTNQFAVMAWRGWLTFDAMRYAGHIHIPVQIIHSEKAAVPEGAKKFYEQLTDEKNMIWVENATQFDFYDQEPFVSNAVMEVAAWFHTLQPTEV